MPNGDNLTAQEHLNDFNASVRTSYSLQDVTKRVIEATSKTGLDRDLAMGQLYKDMVKESVEKSSHFYTVAAIYSPYMKKNVVTRSAANNIGNAIAGLFDKICKENGINYECSLGMGMTNEAYRDFLHDCIKPVTVANTHERYLKVANNSYVLNHMKSVEKTFDENYSFTPNFKNEKSRNIAFYYMNYVAKLAEKNSHGRIWRFFHPIESSRLNKIVATAEARLNKVGFNFEKDPKSVMDYANGTIAGPVSEDAESINANYEKMKNVAQTKKTTALTVARQKLKEAALREGTKEQKGPGKCSETSVFMKVKDVFDKYQMKIPGVHTDAAIPYRMSGGYENDLAKSYDLRRDVSLFKDHIEGNYKIVLYQILSNVVKNNVEVGLADLLKDVARVNEVFLENYTVLYDVKETAEMSKNAAFGNMSKEEIAERIKSNLQTLGATGKYSDEEIKESIEKAQSEYVPQFTNEHLKEEKIEEVNNENPERTAINIPEVKDDDKNKEIAPPYDGSKVIDKNLEKSTS